MRLFISSLRGLQRPGALALLALVATTAGAAPVPVVWIPANGTGVSGGTLSRLGGRGVSATAVGSRALASGAGHFEFTTAETDRAKAAGLGTRDNNAGLEAIDFGFLLRADGTAAVVEKGAVVQSLPNYSAGDLFRVAVEGAAIAFRVNGSLVRTSTLPFAYPLFAEAALAEVGGTISGAELDGTMVEAVTWAGGMKTTSSPGFLAKTTSASAWEAGAFSTMALGPDDGYLEVSATASPNSAMVGLSHGSANSGYSDIDFALYMASGTLYVYEGGVNRGSFGAFAAGDKLRVSVEGGVVTYRKNGALVYSSLVAPTFPLLVDSSLYSSAARISGAVLSGTLVQVAVSMPSFSAGSGLYPAGQNVTIAGEAGSTIHYTTNGSEPTESDPVIASGSSILVDNDAILKAKAWKAGVYPSSTAEAWYVFGTPTAQDVTWTAHVNASSAGNNLAKTTGVVAWNAGAISTQGLASPEGYLEVSASLAPNAAMVGLSNGNANSGYSDIDYALYLASGTLYIYEAGVNRGSFGTMAATDKLRVSVEEGVVRYRKNGILLYSSALAPTYPLLVDASLYSSGATLQGAVLAGALSAAALSSPTFSAPSGIYQTALSVTVTADPGSTIHFTTNGLDPTETDPVIASGSSLLIETTTTLRAKAFASGLIGSGTTAAIYQFGTVSTEDVVWTAQVNTASTGNTLSKTTSVVAWDASAISTRGIISPGGYLEVSASLGPNAAMVGLSHGNTNSGYSDIDYALYQAAGTLYIYEAGLNRGSFGTMLATDRLRVSVESGVVKYRKNGNLIYTSALAPTYPLLVDSSLYSSAASVSSAVLSGTLVQVAASRPVFSVGSGLYSTSQDVVITAEAGSTIHYTTNGAEPTEADDVVASGASVLIDADTTLKAKAWATGLYPSGVTSAIYKLGTATTANVSWSAHVNSTSTGNTLSKSVSTTAWDASAVSSQAIDSPVGYLEVSATLAPKSAMVGLAYGNTNSGYSDIDYALYLSSGTLYIYEGGLNRGSFGTLAAADKLRVSLEAGVVTYRKNGTLLYTSALAPRYPLLVDSSLYSSTAVIQGAVLSGLLVSARTSAPTASPEAGGYTLPMDVALNADSGATIRYTTDGSDPTASSTLYSTVINVPVATTIKARAYKPGYLESEISSHAYFLNAPGAMPTFAPGPGAYVGPLQVTATTSTPGAMIHYTFDGGNPTEADPAVSNGGVIAIPGTGVLRATTFAPGHTSSAVAIAPYEVVTPAPLISPAPGTYISNVTVSIAATPGAFVYYTVDGQNPTPSSTLYTAPFLLTSSGTIKARAWLPGWTMSATGSETYEIQVSDPVLSPPSGRWYTRHDISVTTATPGATIRYTTDGTDPGESATPVDTSGLVRVDRSMTLRVKAFKTGLTPSEATSGRYAITGALGAGQSFMVALKADNTVWAWGRNNSGQLGRGNTVSPQLSPIQVPGLTNIEAVSAGGSHVLALKTDGTVVAWGSNSRGQLGIGNQTNQLSPVVVGSLTGVRAIAAGDDFSMALLANGEIWTWGGNDYGQLADGTSNSRTLPVKSLYPVAPSAPVQLAAGEVFSLVRFADGTVKGAGARARLGINQGSYTAQPTPIAVLLPGGVTEIFAGRSGFAVVTQAGGSQLFGWGDNDFGQLGSGSDQDTGVRALPLLITTGKTMVAAGYWHTIIGGFAAGLAGAGSADSGELGLGLNPRNKVKRFGPIPGAPEAVSLAAGRQFSAALGIDGSVWTWGLGSNGETGQGSTSSIFVPAKLNGFGLVANTNATDDTDGDGVADGVEWATGTDPHIADTNGDGIADGASLLLGQDTITLDPDGDGLTMAQESILGTQPNAADTDGDGVPDGVDAFPLDPTRSTNGAANPNDHTAPVITLQRPIAAIPIS